MLSRRSFLLAATASVAACSFRGGPRGHLRLAAGDPGGMYLAFAELLATRMQARYPDVEVEVVPTEGTVENLALLRSGDVDVGLALADVAERDRVTGPADSEPVAVARVYENYLQVIVRESVGVQHVSELRGRRVSFGAARSGGAATSAVLFDAAGLADDVQISWLRLREALSQLAGDDIEALVWSGGVPTPAVAELNTQLQLRVLDIGALAAPMSRISSYPYAVRRVPAGGYVPPGIRSIGVPNLLLCRREIAEDLVAAMVNVIATESPHLVPPYVRGLQYLDAPSMIQTGAIPLHPGAVGAYRDLHG